MMDTTTYNGWKNYATWGVALVLDNDPGTYETCREAVAEFKRDPENDPRVISGVWTADESVRFNMADWLKDYVEGMCDVSDVEAPDLYPMMAAQVIGAGLADVDWDEIAAHYVDES